MPNISDLTNTQKHNQYFKTSCGKVGYIAPVPQIDPVILEFSDGKREVFRLRDIEPTTKPLTYSPKSHMINTRKGQVLPITIDKMLQLLDYLISASGPIKLKDAEKDLGFKCTYLMSKQINHDAVTSLEELGIVTRIPLGRGWLAWEVTTLGITDGKDLIRSHHLPSKLSHD